MILALDHPIKMQFSTIAFGPLFAATSLVSAAPLEENKLVRRVRDNVNANLFEHKNYGGKKALIQVAEADFFKCINFTGSNTYAYMNDTITSYSAQQGCCGFYRHANCVDRMFTAENRYDSVYWTQCWKGEQRRHLFHQVQLQLCRAVSGEI